MILVLSISSASTGKVNHRKGVIRMKSKLILLALTLTLVGLAVFGVSQVQAQSSQGKYPSIVQKLVQRFGLKENDVQAVFDEARQERQSQMQARFEERLNQAVKDGKITESQKQAILAKHKELQEKRLSEKENWQNTTPEQRRQAIQEKKQELESWANQNGIDLKYLFGWFGMKRGHGWFR